MITPAIGQISQQKRYWKRLGIEKNGADMPATLEWKSPKEEEEEEASATIKTQFVRKATGSHIIKSTSLEKTRSPVSAFCYARNQVSSNAGLGRFLVSFNCEGLSGVDFHEILYYSDSTRPFLI